MANVRCFAKVKVVLMADEFRNDKYLGLVKMLGPENSVVFVEQLFKDLSAARNDLMKAQSEASMKLLDASTHVIASLAGTVGAQKLYQMALDVNDQAVAACAPFPVDDTKMLVSKLEPWMSFLLSEVQNDDVPS